MLGRVGPELVEALPMATSQSDWDSGYEPEALSSLLSGRGPYLVEDLVDPLLTYLTFYVCTVWRGKK